MANISFDVIHLCQTILQCSKTTKEEASVVEVFQDVLYKLSDVGKKNKLLKFFKLVQDGKFPLNKPSVHLCVQ
jgi:hypothetical protein